MRMARTKKERHVWAQGPRIKSAGCAARCARSLLQTFLAGLVVFAERLNPIPSRTRPLNFPAPMVLSLKAWKSRSLPGLPRTLLLLDTMIDFKKAASNGGLFYFTAVWNYAPTTTPPCAGETPLASPQTSGQPAARPLSNARCGALESTAPIVIARVPEADAAP